MSFDAYTPTTSGPGRAAEHRAILQLVHYGDMDPAIVATSRHLAQTPLLLLAEVAAEVEPAAIRSALSNLGALAPARPLEGRARMRTA
jgi:hypothetical protein